MARLYIVFIKSKLFSDNQFVWFLCLAVHDEAVEINAVSEVTHIHAGFALHSIDAISQNLLAHHVEDGDFSIDSWVESVVEVNDAACRHRIGVAEVNHTIDVFNI